jgi:unsaturated chondroitin disaccharide hydrolase
MCNAPELDAGIAEAPVSSASEAVLFAGAIERMLQRIDATAAEVGEAFPLSADPGTGRWMTAPDGRWTGGFWVGQLWLALQASGDPKYRALAEAALARLEVRLERDNVLNGLVFYYGAALGGLLDENAAGTAMGKRGAAALARHYRPGPGFIPLGHDSGSLTADAAGETNIDGVPGMGLLWWAAQAVGDPAFAGIAANHVRRHIDLCQRPDGSLYQAALVDPANGATLRLYSPRGYAADTSTWARAQSWGLLGFVQAYAWTKDAFFLDAAVRAADWWLGAVPSDRVAFWDFDDPAIPATERDTSATAMTAAALLKLARLAPEAAQRETYAEAGALTVRALVERYLAPTHAGDERPHGMLTEGCWQRNQGMSTRHELVWGDYFLLEALLMLTGRLERVI